MGGKGGGSAPSPDPNIGIAALKQAELGGEWLDFARDQFEIANERQAGLDDLTKRVGEQQLATAKRSDKWAAQDRRSGKEDREWALGQRDQFSNMAKGIYRDADRYSGWARDDRAFAEQLRGDYDQFRPVNERIVSDAMDWDSDARLSQEAGRARADVLRNADLARQQSTRQMAAMGINPNSGRFQAADRLSALEAGLTSAGAQNAARDSARQQAVGMRQNAAALGQNVLGQSQQATGMANSTAGLANQTRGLGMQADNMAMGAAGFAAGQYNAGLGAAGLGVNAGAAAQSGALANQNSFLASTGIMGQGYQGAMSGYGSQASILNQQYQNQLQGWAANQQATGAGIGGLFSGIGNIVGAGIQSGAWFGSSKEIKTDKKPAAGALQAVKGLPVETWRYKDEAPDKRHVGPYAEDVKEATGIGTGKALPVQDMIGLTMKAVQELDDKVERIAGKRGSSKREVTA